MAVYSALLYLHLVICSPSSSWFSCCKSQASQFHQFSSFSTLQCRPTQHLEGKTIQVCLCECASVCVSVCVSLSLVSLCLIIFVFLHGAVKNKAVYTACVTPTGWSKKRKTVEWKFPFNFYPFFGPRGTFYYRYMVMLLLYKVISLVSNHRANRLIYHGFHVAPRSSFASRFKSFCFISPRFIPKRYGWTDRQTDQPTGISSNRDLRTHLRHH